MEVKINTMFEMTPFEKSYRSLFSRNPFADLEKNFFGNLNSIGEFQTDIQDQGDSFLLEADLPGFDKKDIQVDVHHHRLTIKATRRSQQEQQNEKGGYGSFSRSFDIDAIQEDQISASYADGVLRLTLPKKQEALPASHQIEIQ